MITTVAAVEFVPLTLGELVAKSEVVVVGQIQDLQTACATCESGWAELRIDKSLKGATSQGRSIRVVAHTHGQSSDYKVDETVVLFLRKWKEGFAPVAGYVGVVTVADRKADARFIKALAKEIPEDKFIQMVSREVALQEARSTKRQKQ